MDASFGTGGLVTTDFTDDLDIANAIAIDADGRIVVAGQAYFGSGLGSGFALARCASSAQAADLMVSLGVDKTSVKQGESLTYTITVRNFGPTDAVNAVVDDSLSSGTRFLGAWANRGSFTTPPVNQTGVVTWHLGNLANNGADEAQLVVQIAVRGKTTITNSATVTSDSPDPNSANNTAFITTSVAPGGSGKPKKK